jgi:hypothetical protein
MHIRSILRGLLGELLSPGLPSTSYSAPVTTIPSPVIVRDETLSPDDLPFPVSCLDLLGPDEAVLKLETRSLAQGSPLLAIGLLCRSSGFDGHGEVRVCQVVSCDPGYSHQFAQEVDLHLSRFSELITFSGASFDVPRLAHVATSHHLTRLSDHLASVSLTDVLHHYFGFYHRYQLPSCTLPFLAALFLGDIGLSQYDNDRHPELVDRWWEQGDAGALELILANNRNKLLAIYGLHLVDHYRTSHCAYKELPTWFHNEESRDLIAQVMMDTGYLLISRPAMSDEETATFRALRTAWEGELAIKDDMTWRFRHIPPPPRAFAFLDRRFYVGVYFTSDIDTLLRPPHAPAIRECLDRIAGPDVELRFIRNFHGSTIRDLDTPPKKPLPLPSFSRCQKGEKAGGGQ